MKTHALRRIVSLITLNLTLMSAHADITSGLIAYYPFNENAADASLHGHTATPFNGVTYALGKFGFAAQLDGVNDYFRVPSHSDFALSSNFTAAFWCAPQTVGWILWNGPDNGPPFTGQTWMAMYNENNRIAFEKYGFNNVWIQGPVASAGVWTHVAVVVRSDGDTGWLYINGSLVGTNSAGAKFAVPPTSLWIGRRGPSSSQYYGGLLDELRIYSRALSASEIRQLYNQPEAPVLIVTNRATTVSETGSGTIPTSNQLRVFSGGEFQTNALVYSNRMTIVLTHGWNSNPDVWAKGMATSLMDNIGPAAANILTWDWSAKAAGIDPFVVSQKTPGQGKALGRTLIQSLGPDYNQPIHFIGHSFGTLLNAVAVDYLHKDCSVWSLLTRPSTSAGAYQTTNTHMTLLDEAEIDPKIVKGILGTTLSKIDGGPLPARAFYDQPLPKRKAWADNYISLVGLVHDDAVNVVLTNQLGAIASARTYTQLLQSLTDAHAYPCGWYSNSVMNSTGSLMGNRWSFERGGLLGVPALGGAFVQAYATSELDLVTTTPLAARVSIAQRLGALSTGLGYTLVADFKNRLAAINGVVQSVVQSAVPNDPFAGPLTSGSVWSVDFTLQTTAGVPAAAAGIHPADASDGGNNPACLWATVTVPSNAVSMSFDFLLQGNGQADLFSAAVNGTNVLSIETSLLETNVLVNSGLIDIVPWAGKEVELFFGITGGTSTNANITVQSIRFYENIAPTLSARLDGANIVLSWPLFTGNSQLQATTDLGDTNSWTAVTNEPVLVNSLNTVTNDVTGTRRFYRLGPAP